MTKADPQEKATEKLTFAARDVANHTPLHIAAENGDAAVVSALLARGADPHAVDAEDKTPLSRAAARNHAAIVDLINTGPGAGPRP